MERMVAGPRKRGDAGWGRGETNQQRFYRLKKERKRDKKSGERQVFGG